MNRSDSFLITGSSTLFLISSYFRLPGLLFSSLAKIPAFVPPSLHVPMLESPTYCTEWSLTSRRRRRRRRRGGNSSADIFATPRINPAEALSTAPGRSGARAIAAAAFRKPGEISENVSRLVAPPPLSFSPSQGEIRPLDERHISRMISLKSGRIRGRTDERDEGTNPSWPTGLSSQSRYISLSRHNESAALCLMHRAHSRDGATSARLKRMSIH